MPGTLFLIQACAIVSIAISAAAPTSGGGQSIIFPTQASDFNLEPSADYSFSGITTFRRLNSSNCLIERGPVDDILIVGIPFDTATSYRSGTRFGPNAIRQGSRAGSLAYV
jgi:agmatinase